MNVSELKVKYLHSLLRKCFVWFIILVSANVFGKAKTNTDYLPYNGDGFKLLVPAKWNPSKEREFPGQVLRYEDNFDATSNVSVLVQTTDKKSITDYGSPEEFLSKVLKQSLTFASFLSILIIFWQNHQYRHVFCFMVE